MNDTNKDILNNMLEPENKKEVSDLDVLKELFINKNIESKTDLTIEQVILINQKRTIAKLLNFNHLNDSLNDFMILLVSRNRLGRGEFVKSFISEREHKVEQSGGFFNNIKNKLM